MWTYFLKTHGIFYFFTLPLEIPDKIKLHPWKFHKIALDPLEIPRPNHQDTWKFHICFSWSPLEISFAISLMPLEIPFPLTLPPLRLIFFWNSPFEDGQLASYLAKYLPESCVVFYVLGSHKLFGGILVRWPIQCISRKITLDFSV